MGIDREIESNVSFIFHRQEEGKGKGTYTSFSTDADPVRERERDSNVTFILEGKESPPPTGGGNVSLSLTSGAVGVDRLRPPTASAGGCRRSIERSVGDLDDDRVTGGGDGDGDGDGAGG